VDHRVDPGTKEIPKEERLHWLRTERGTLKQKKKKKKKKKNKKKKKKKKKKERRGEVKGENMKREDPRLGEKAKKIPVRGA